jgi:purine nucleosidase
MRDHRPFLIILLILLIVVQSACSPQTATIVTSTPETKELPKIPASLVVFPLAGEWRGSAKNGTFEMQVIINMESACQVGQMCGSIDLHNVPCSATFTLIGVENNIYEFKAGDKKGSCGVGRDFLQLLSDGTLQYTSRGDYGETLGILVSTNTSPSAVPVLHKIPIIDDDDGDPSGTSALLYLLNQPNVDLKAATICYGEAHPAIYIQHIGRMLDDFGFTNILLGAGMDGNLSAIEGFPEWIRERSGKFWDMPIPNSSKTYPVQDSADLFISIIKNSPEPVTLFFSGPLTSLAQALRIAPEIRGKIAALYMMGGAVYTPGNITAIFPDSENKVSEWNIYADPQAAKEVFESGLKMYLIPLDATNLVTISKKDTAQLRKGGRIANFVADIYDSWMDFAKRPIFYIWDLMSAMIMIKPELCSFQALHLEVVTARGNSTGQTAVIPGKTPNIDVCLKPDAALIKRMMIDDFLRSR